MSKGTKSVVGLVTLGFAVYGAWTFTKIHVLKKS